MGGCRGAWGRGREGSRGVNMGGRGGRTACGSEGTCMGGRLKEWQAEGVAGCGANFACAARGGE